LEDEIESANGFEGSRTVANVSGVRVEERLWTWSVESHDAEMSRDVAGSYATHLTGSECDDSAVLEPSVKSILLCDSQHRVITSIYASYTCEPRGQGRQQKPHHHSRQSMRPIERLRTRLKTACSCLSHRTDTRFCPMMKLEACSTYVGRIVVLILRLKEALVPHVDLNVG
jgi:hypothetical protein